ncbi:MAG: hypothetical protein RTU92_08150 [Candidatus Thorarchaeota archaeon]
MLGHNIQALLIMDKGGIPHFFMRLDPRAMDLDPMLVSGFFKAIQNFSREVIEKGSSEFQVDYGARLFTVIGGDKLDLIAISVGTWLESVSPILSSLIREFEVIWSKLSTNEKDTIDLHQDFDDYRERIIQRLSFREVSPNWVPFLIDTGERLALEVATLLDPYIDGMRSIEGIITESGLRREEVLTEISRLWAIGSLNFRSIIDPTDIVIPTSRIDRLLQSSSTERSELARLHPEVIAILPRLVPLFDGRRTVGLIIRSLEDQHDERDLMQAIDYLLESNAIEALSSEKRRILLVKEALDIAIRVAEKIYSYKVAYGHLNTAISDISVPEVSGEIKHTDDRWWIDYESRLYEGLDPLQLMGLYSEWMKLLAQYVGLLEKKQLKKFTESLVGAYTTYLLERYSEQDLRGFEEFAFWIEMINTGK